MQFAGEFRHTESIVAILSVDDGTFVDVNPAFERVVGWRRDEVMGKRTIDLDLWPDFELRATIWAQLRSGAGIRDLAVRFRSRDGTIRNGRLDCELMEGDRGVAVFCLLRDYAEASPFAPTVADERAESYRALFQAAAEGIYRSLPQGGFIDVNPAMASIFGYESPTAMLRELERASFALYVDPGHGAAVVRQLEEHGRIDQVESEVFRRDGSRIWISENARSVRDEAGRLLFHEGTVVDITERREAEAALRQSEALYKVLVDNCRDGVFLIQRGRVLFANRALAAMLGYTEQELIDFSYFDLIAPEDRAAQQVRRSQREAGSQEVQRYELHMLHRDGHRVLCAVHADAVQYKGDIASTGVIRDVTEERRQRAALEDAERRYREIFERSPAGLFRTASNGRILEANPELARILGYDTSEQFKQLRSMAEVYADPAERDRLVQRVMADGKLDDYETQIRRRDGSMAWVSTSVRLLRGDDGEPQFAGSVLDLTGRRRAEEALQRSESKFRTLVEHSQVGVFISRGDRYAYVNHRLCEMLGYPEDELLRLGLTDLVAPEYLPATEERLRLVEQGTLLLPDFESCYLCRDGSRIYVTVSLGPLQVDGEHHLTGTVRDITRHREAEHRLRFHATHDPLTGLPNRMLFQRRLDEVLREARDGGVHDYTVLFLDLDGFKLVNDSLGHAAGDRLLVVIGELLTRTLAEEALVARYGGDEFTILPHGSCDQARAVALAERILELFSAPFDIDSHQAFSGASLGIVLGHEDYSKPDQVLRDADTAMYRAKAGGKSGYVIFDEAMHAAARQRFQLETDFRLAFEREEFRVFYQPVVSLQGGAITGFEALVRWAHPQRGLLGPGEFLHVAEESGLIATLDWWVLHQACRQVAEWQRRIPESIGIGISVNVDERQVSARDVLARMEEVLRISGIAPDSLTLEVTETVFRSGRGPATPMLQSLKALGLGLAVDDFGTGYSSLDSFASAPFDTLKIDQSFIRDMEINHRHRAIVRTISGFAEDLGLALTAEGVETPGQARLLLAMGCQTAQGYLYSPPLPAHEAEALLRHGIPASRQVGYG